MKYLITLLALTFIVFRIPLANAAPIRQTVTPQKLSVIVKRSRGTAFILKEPLKANVTSPQLQWEYIPSSSISVPYIDIKLSGIPIPNQFTILAERSGKLTPDPEKGYLARVPLLKQKNSLLFTIVDASGQYEDWQIEISLGLQESAVFVDENCSSYVFQLRETLKTKSPNLLFVGCRPGSGPKNVSLDILWGDVSQVQYAGKSLQASQSIVSLPLESKKTSESELVGTTTDGGKSIFLIHYEPYVLPPYEIWAGLAFYRSYFTQSNFASGYQQSSAALLAQFWYRPEESRLSLMARTFGTLGSFFESLDPNAGYRESVLTWLVDVELRYMLFDISGWRMDLMLGGWFFFMDVASRNFGAQRIIDPVIGLYFSKEIGTRNRLSLTGRLVPLQEFPNPFAFTFTRSYLELELTFTHAFRQRNKVFGTLYWGNLLYNPDGFASQWGSYVVLGGGLGW